MSANKQQDKTRTETLLRGLYSSGLGVIYHDADLSIRFVENVPASWPDDASIIAAGYGVVFDPFTAERIHAAQREVLAGGASQRIEAPLRLPSSEMLWFDINIERDIDPEGGARGLFVSISEITQLKQREASLRDLLFQVSHRSRNMLAILQSILGQTADKAKSVTEFERKFRGRIASIAQSQDLITYANWQWVRFGSLAESQVALFSDSSAVAPGIEGLDPLLSPNATLHIGLALHELAANSSEFGVLGQGVGVVRILASPRPDGFRLEWIETPDQPLVPRANAAWGFGRIVLQNVVPRALRAEASFTIDEEGVYYALDVPEQGDEASSARPGAATTPEIDA